MTNEGGDGEYVEMEGLPGAPFVHQGTQYTKRSLKDPLRGNRDARGGEMVR